MSRHQDVTLCPACQEYSSKAYRCTNCGKDLVEAESVEGGR